MLCQLDDHRWFAVEFAVGDDVDYFVVDGEIVDFESLLCVVGDRTRLDSFLIGIDELIQCTLNCFLLGFGLL